MRINIDTLPAWFFEIRTIQQAIDADRVRAKEEARGAVKGEGCRLAGG